MAEVSAVPVSFDVRWIRVDPSSVEAPPTNNFYNYFSKLWNPIQDTYNNLLSGNRLLLAALNHYIDDDDLLKYIWIRTR